MPLVLRIAVVLVALGLCESASAGWVQALHPKDIRAYGAAGTSSIIFATVEPISNPAACGGSEFYYVAYDPNGNHRNALAILLTALTTDRTIWVYVVDNQCSPPGRPLVTDVIVN
jgi:hypothetical protein